MSTNNLSKQSIGQNKIRSPAHHPVLSNQPQHQHQFQRSRHSDNAVIDELDHSKCDDTKDLPEERSRRAKVSFRTGAQQSSFINIPINGGLNTIHLDQQPLAR